MILADSLEFRLHEIPLEQPFVLMGGVMQGVLVSDESMLRPTVRAWSFFNYQNLVAVVVSHDPVCRSLSALTAVQNAFNLNALSNLEALNFDQLPIMAGFYIRNSQIATFSSDKKYEIALSYRLRRGTDLIIERTESIEKRAHNRDVSLCKAEGIVESVVISHGSGFANSLEHQKLERVVGALRETRVSKPNLHTASKVLRAASHDVIVPNEDPSYALILKAGFTTGTGRY
jgi:hypothetical protein